MLNNPLITYIYICKLGLSLTVYDSLAKRYMQSTTRKPVQNSAREEKLRQQPQVTGAMDNIRIINFIVFIIRFTITNDSICYKVSL
jgi:hypothetical protein